MAAQHKRPGRTARERRKKQVQKKQVKVIVFKHPKPAMHGPGKVVAVAEVV